MPDLQNIIATWENLQTSNQQAALATVIRVRGSTYRRPGARMLVLSSGERLGLISGGCLENEVSLQALEVIATNQPTVVSYDAIANEALLWGLGLGCNGAIEILIQPIQPQTWNPIRAISQCLKQRQSGILATVIQTRAAIPTQLGESLLYSAETVKHNLSDSQLIELITADLTHHTQSSQKSSQTRTYQLCQGEVTVLIELIKPPTPLILLGAGDDAIPVAQLAKSLGWQVTVVDRRSDYALSERFPTTDQIMVSSAEQGLNRLKLDTQTVAVIMTHNYWEDRDWLRLLLPSPVAYLGILGPKHRTQQLVKDLEEEGLTPTSAQLERFYSPIGLDIGGDTPEAIALSIVAEIQAVLAQRSGTFLRTRDGSIH